MVGILDVGFFGTGFEFAIVSQDVLVIATPRFVAEYPRPHVEEIAGPGLLALDSFRGTSLRTDQPTESRARGQAFVSLLPHLPLVGLPITALIMFRYFAWKRTGIAPTGLPDIIWWMDLALWACYAIALFHAIKAYTRIYSPTDRIMKQRQEEFISARIVLMRQGHAL